MPALAAARRAVAGGVMLSSVPACTSSGQQTRGANLIGRLNATRARCARTPRCASSGPRLRCIPARRRDCDDRPRARLSDHRNKMRRASCHRSKRIAQTMCGHAQQLTYAGVAGKLRQHRYTIDRRGQRDHRRDARRPRRRRERHDRRKRKSPTAQCVRGRRRQLPGGGNCRVVVLALACGRHQLARRPARRAEPAVVEQHHVESGGGEAARIVHQGAGVPGARESRCHHHARHARAPANARRSR